MQRPRPIPPAAAMRQQVRATGHRTTEEPGTQPTGQNSPVLQKAQPTGQRPSPKNKPSLTKQKKTLVTGISASCISSGQ